MGTERDSEYKAEQVVLLAEDVDRNILQLREMSDLRMSSSSRRTWIEIQGMEATVSYDTVVLLAEDVDRNPLIP